MSLPCRPHRLIKVWNEGDDGQSLGRYYLGIRVVHPVLDPEKGPVLKDTGLTQGPGPLGTPPDRRFSCVGFFRPLWNERRQTFADSLTKTIVIIDTELQLDCATVQAML